LAILVDVNERVKLENAKKNAFAVFCRSTRREKGDVMLRQFAGEKNGKEPSRSHTIPAQVIPRLGAFSLTISRLIIASGLRFSCSI